MIYIRPKHITALTALQLYQLLRTVVPLPPSSPFHIVLKPRRCRDCPKIQDFIHAPPPPPFTKLSALLWHLVSVVESTTKLGNQNWSWISCHFEVWNLGKEWRGNFSNIVQHEYGGQSSVPSLSSWRFANILMGFVNLPLCISEPPLFAEAKIQNKSPDHLYISIPMGEEKRTKIRWNVQHTFRNQIHPKFPLPYTSFRPNNWLRLLYEPNTFQEKVR